MTSTPSSADIRIGFMVHKLSHAIAVRSAAQIHNVPVLLVSAPGAVRTGGAGWWREMMAQATTTNPHADAKSILDCGDEPGMALAAIREDVEAIALSAPEPAFESVRSIAEQSGTRLQSIHWDDVFDLIGSNNPQADCENHLLRRSGNVANPGALG
ncbi:MAG: hypothetical protein OSB67_08405 [Alphaproteobacteria bacterium]|jgi:hypothetical protein|nr:hypothetical protein [Alphaproteobacteria bacterium]